MWAIGWICWEIVTGRLPFEELNYSAAIICRTVTGQLPPVRDDTQLSHVLMLCNLMSNCWISEPAKRIDASTFHRKVGMVSSETPARSPPGGQKARSASLHLELGEMYVLQSDRAKAESHYLSAIEVSRRTKDEATSANCVGAVTSVNSDFREGKESTKQAQETPSGLRNNWVNVASLGDLRDMYGTQSKDAEAERSVGDSRETQASIGDSLDAAYALHGLGEIYRAQSRKQEAEKAFSAAHEIHSRIGHDLGVADALLGLGHTYHAQSRNQEAEKAFSAAHEIHSRIGSDLGAANALD
ncbi:hypothetical protein M407DRAFT_35187, partial [Tulasnella calospora MUT 4182]